MRWLYTLGFISLTTLIMTSCSQNSSHPMYEVLEETYIHQYGVEVPPEDWTARGQDGQVVSTLSNGVIIRNNYCKGVLHGDSTQTFPHSNVVEVARTYSEQNLTRERTNYPSGNPKQEVRHNQEGGRHIVTWYQDGTPQSIEEYDAQGALEKGEYYDRDHHLEAWVDSKEGMRILRDTYGQLIFRDTIQDGEMTCRTSYHANGNPRSIISYRHGNIEGQCKNYLPDGEPESIAEWVGGRQQGLTTLYKNGEKVAEIHYENGQKSGVEHHFRNGSVIVEETMWKEGKRHGPSSICIGDTVKTDWYFNGDAVTRANYEELSARVPVEIR